MRISFSGTASVGKTTLLEAFKNRWPMYTSPTKTYRDIIKEHNLEHSSNTCENTQLLILDWMMRQQESNIKGSKVIYDRCTWDNLTYTLESNASNKISDEVTAAVISLVRESLKNIDIIFWIKHNPKNKIVNDGVRDVNKEYILAIDSIFEGLYKQYMDNLESDVFYPKDDCPAIICIDESFSTVDDRIAFISEFIDYKGDLIETTNSILSPENSDLLEAMIGDQINAKNSDNRLKKIIKEFKK